MSWQVQEAKQRFSEVLRAAETDGPQTITRHGNAVAVIIDIDRYRKLTQPERRFADHLLAMPKLSEDAAAVFARGSSSTGAAKTVSVICVLEVTSAKDIKDLSLYANEAEWLLMPGATFTVGTPIKEPLDKYGDPPPGAPPATECYTVHLKQTK